VPFTDAFRGPSMRRRLGTDMRSLYDRCVRCGITVPSGRSVCRRCNPADLPSPSPSQYHAIVYLTILVTLVLAAVFLLLRS